MGKWLSALKWLVVAVVLAVFIGLLIKWNRKGGISVEVGFDDRIELTSQEIRRIEQIGQWEFLSVQSEVVADTLRKGFFTDDRLVAVYTGVPRIGIDMNRVTGEWAQAHGDTVTLCLPAVHLLDKNFNIIYCHYNIGKFPWGAILNGNYYYINDINEIVKVNLTTFESKSIASNGKAFMADNDENFIYYSNEFSELYKLSPDDESSIKIADNALFFSVQNKYIYASGGDNGNKIIYDKNGKIIADYSACVNMGADSAFQINDKIYTIFNGGVAYMDLDGKNYGEMMQ